MSSTYITRHHPRSALPAPVPFLLLATVALGALLLAPKARADAPNARYDYSRFSDGPRQVPAPRGPSLRRAEALGLGGRRVASRLLSAPPPPEWLAAAPGGELDDLLWPVEVGRLGRGFGFTRRQRRDLRHDGLDIVAPAGSPVRAVADGIVAYSDNGVRGFGNLVILVHGNGLVSLYAHNQRNTVPAGFRVRRGERIALLGSTGISRGPHLHFELREGGRLRDPMRYLEAPPRRRNRAVATAEATPAEASDPPSVPATGGDREAGVPDGSLALARSLRSAPPSAALVARSEGRRFPTLLWPVRGGYLGNPFRGRHHRGIDVTADPGTPVRAAADGLVAYVGDFGTLGKTLILVHPDGRVTLYGDVDAPAVRVGDQVARGAWIAHVGRNRNSEDSHLHFEVRQEGNDLDPEQLLVQRPDLRDIDQEVETSPVQVARR